jgi:hypothetical protein
MRETARKPPSAQPPMLQCRDRQSSAKSRQVLSIACPAILMVCHSSPHVCMRWREAVGKGPVAPSAKGTSPEVCGEAGALACGEAGAWACSKACGIIGVVAGRGGAPATTGSLPILAGRAGGSGVTADDFALATGSCAAALFIDAIPATTASAAARQPTAPTRVGPPRAGACKRGASSIRSITSRLSTIHSEAEHSVRLEPAAANAWVAARIPGVAAKPRSRRSWGFADAASLGSNSRFLKVRFMATRGDGGTYFGTACVLVKTSVLQRIFKTQPSISALSAAALPGTTLKVMSYVLPSSGL